MTYTIELRGEKGEGLGGQVEYYDSAGGLQGFSELHATTTIDESEIPAGTATYRFSAPGYSWYGTSQLGEYTTITLVKETPVAKYVLLGAAGLGALLLLKRLLKY